MSHFLVQDSVSKAWVISSRFVALGPIENAVVFRCEDSAKNAADQLDSLIERHRIWHLHNKLTTSPLPVFELVSCTLHVSSRTD